MSFDCKLRKNTSCDDSKKYRVVIFDLDGTLINSVEGVIRSVEVAVERFGFKVNSNDRKKFIGPPIPYSFEKLFGLSGKSLEKAVDDYTRRYEDEGIKEAVVYDGVREMLELLRSRGVALAVATLKPEAEAIGILGHFDLLRYFDAVSGPITESDEAKKERVINGVFRLLGGKYEKSAAILIGDTKFDILGAKSCGIASVGVKYGFAVTPDEIDKCAPDHICKNVSELTELLLGIT